MTAMKKVYKEISMLEATSEMIEDIVGSIVEGFYVDERMDSLELLDRIEGSIPKYYDELEGAYVALCFSSVMEDEAIQFVLKLARKIKRELSS